MDVRPSLWISTPCYGGQVLREFSTSMLKLYKMCIQNNIDIILTDFYLGKVKSDKYVESFKQKQSIPVILMTALPSYQLKKYIQLRDLTQYYLSP